MLVCLCCQFNDDAIERSLSDVGLQATIDTIKRGKGCRSCLPTIKDMYYEGQKLDYVKTANDIGLLVSEKNKAYGDSFGEASKILEVLYPDGIPKESYRDALALIRVIDKLFRLANKKDAFGESPWRDICGYALLGVVNDEAEKSGSGDA